MGLTSWVSLATFTILLWSWADKHPYEFSFSDWSDDWYVDGLRIGNLWCILRDSKLWFLVLTFWNLMYESHNHVSSVHFLLHRYYRWRKSSLKGKPLLCCDHLHDQITRLFGPPPHQKKKKIVFCDFISNQMIDLTKDWAGGNWGVWMVDQSVVTGNRGGLLRNRESSGAPTHQ